jgi:hypothetical protein
MFDFVCPHCDAVTVFEGDYLKKKKKCKGCGQAIDPVIFREQWDAAREKIQQAKNRKLFLPMLLSLSALVAFIVGVVAKSWPAGLGTLVVLAGLAWYLNRTVGKWI